MYNSNNKFKNGNLNNNSLAEPKNFRKNNLYGYNDEKDDLLDEELMEDLEEDYSSENKSLDSSGNYYSSQKAGDDNSDKNKLEKKKVKKTRDYVADDNLSHKKPKKPTITKNSTLDLTKGAKKTRKLTTGTTKGVTKAAKGATKAAKGAAKTVKSATKAVIRSTRVALSFLKVLFAKYWVIILGVLIILFTFSLAILMLLNLFDRASGKGAGSGGLLATYSNCDYITVDGEQIEFEKYIAGVVTAENGNSDFPEAMKAQAVAARTYALYTTNYCKSSIKNSQANQVYKEPSEAGYAAAKATENEIMLDSSGNIVPAYYASYPSGAEFNWSYGSCDKPLCNGTTCSVSLYKVPSGNKYTFVMDQYNNGNTWNGSELTNQGGHCYGMSQLGARYLEKQGYDYREILSNFYDYEPASMKQGIGAIIGKIFGFTTRSTKPTSNDTEWTTENLFYASNRNLIGQCTWYAHGRALEILKNSGLSAEELKKAKSILNNMSGNAGTWFESNKNLGGNGFAYGAEPKLGAIVVWTYGEEAYNSGACNNYNYPTAGHVGIVEQVNKNVHGEVTSLRISDGWKTGSGSGWETVNFQYSEWSIDRVKSYNNGCRVLAGYVYLVE